MRAIFLSGFMSGLGKEIHDLLVGKNNYELFFIGRQSILNSVDNRHYLRADFACADYSWVNDINIELYDFDDVVFINNAATIDPIGSLEDYSISKLDRSIQINFLTPVHLIQKLKIISRSIKIINITSGAAQKSIPYWAGYCSSKAAMKMFLDVMEYEQGVEVVHFDPGVMDTKMQEIIREKSDRYEQLRGFVDIYDSGELKEPKNVASSVIGLID